MDGSSIHEAGIAIPPAFPELVQQMLEREIIQGRMAEGERVSEDELAQRLGVSRTPVREAMRALEAHGLMVRRRGRGTFVARLASSGEAKALYRLRAPLEGFLAERAAANITASEIEELGSLEQALQRAFEEHESSDLSALIDADSRFHWCIYEAARSELVTIVRSYWGRLMREMYARAYINLDDIEALVQQHVGIVAAVSARDSAAARVAMELHLESGWDVVRESFDAV